jgi:hypothetical protein
MRWIGAGGGVAMRAVRGWTQRRLEGKQRQK